MRGVLLLVAALVAVSASADLPRGEWRVARPIILPALKASGLVYLPLDAEALAGVGSRSEYRIVDANQAETPYRMVVEEGRSEVNPVPVKVVSQATGKAGMIQAVLDLGADSRLANVLRLKLEGNNFRARVVMNGADEENQPGLRLGEGLVYRHEGKFEQMRVVIPPHEQRYLRLTVTNLQGKAPKLAGVVATGETWIPRKLVEAPAKLTRRDDAEAHATILDLDMGRLTWDLAEARFDVEEETFDRPMTVQSSAASSPSEEQYDWGRSGKLRRLAAGRAVVVTLSVSPARWLRFSIENGDDRPLSISDVKLWRVRQGLVFSASPGASYELWYGRRGAAQPVYDIQRLPLTTPPAELAQATLGAPRQMPLKPPPPPPWSERHPAYFWIVLIAVLVLLLLMIVKAIRGAKRAGAA